MSDSLKKIIGISGATGFVGKNLREYFDQNNTPHIQITRTIFQRKKIPLLPNCFCLVHLIGIGAESGGKNFQEVNIDISFQNLDQNRL